MCASAVKILGVNRAVVWINITNAWGLARGLLSFFFIVTYLSAEQQGLWYTFSNLAALAIFAELGFSAIVSQFISHEYSKLKFVHGHLTGDTTYIDRLISLARYAIKIYVIVVLVGIVILSVVGVIYFKEHSHVVLAAWVFFSLTGGLNLFAGLLQSIYRGLDKVADTQKAGFVSSLAAALCTWIALIFGLNIWALPIGGAASVLVLVWMTINLAPGFWRQLHRHQLTRSHNWGVGIIWLQGKYAITFISGYFIFNLLVPAVYKFEGAILAGQLGLTMGVVAVIQGFATATVTANVPRLNMLIAAGNGRESYQLALKTTITSVFLYCTGALLLIAVTTILIDANIYRDRFLSLPLLIVVLTYQLAPTLTAGASAFLRAHKEEPHLPLSIVQSIIIATAIFTIMPLFGLFWVLVVFNLVFWLISVPWIAILAVTYRRRHHYIE